MRSSFAGKFKTNEDWGLVLPVKEFAVWVLQFTAWCTGFLAWDVVNVELPV